MAPKKKEKPPPFVSQRPPFDYTPIRPEEYERVVTLTVKLVSWSYLNFVVRLPINTPLATIKTMILSQYKGGLTNRSLTGFNGPDVSDITGTVSGLTSYDWELLRKCTNRDIRLYKGSPLTFPPLPDDDLLTLQDVGFLGATPDEPPLEADIFYDFTSGIVLGKGKQRM
ncbi:hypothetical protein GMRT_12223 [Giardia muris]|uniref:Uncharacterized protein n=1 Tax=Giardia muris TaxID=5742 RepID=A0A4Z1T906_GIAMU|nr:hypothetical protein GMRT_12223 [Giardia muris]|eukprot:TNJ30623.1 hypothetical protein GMRT_12223 [Giardia muris]